jgi:hypothetical protein
MRRFVPFAFASTALVGAALSLPHTLEVACYAVLLAWLVGRKPLRTLLGQLGMFHRVFLVLFITAVLAGQVMQRETKTYPVVAWPMFTRPVAGDPDYFEYMGDLSDGREVELLVREELFPHPLGQNLMVQLARLARSIASSDGAPGTPEAAARYEGMVQAVAEKYNAAHPGQPVHAVRVWRCTIPARDYHGQPSIRREPFRTVRLP